MIHTWKKFKVSEINYADFYEDFLEMIGMRY